MQLIIICQVCGTQLVSIQKDVVTQDDINQYQENCSCGMDGQQNIQVQVTNNFQFIGSD